MVDWVSTEVINGEETVCSPYIRFKCLMFLNNKQKTVYLDADIPRNNRGEFIHKAVTFKITLISGPSDD